MAYERKEGYPTRVERDDVDVSKFSKERPKLTPRDHGCLKWVNGETGEEVENPVPVFPTERKRRR